MRGPGVRGVMGKEGGDEGCDSDVWRIETM